MGALRSDWRNSWDRAEPQIAGQSPMRLGVRGQIDVAFSMNKGCLLVGKRYTAGITNTADSPTVSKWKYLGITLLPDQS